jgi:glycine dehydrogenase
MTKSNDSFIPRHIGPSQKDIHKMLKVIGSDSLEALVNETIPKSILSKKPLIIGKDVSEYDLTHLSKNKIFILLKLILAGYQQSYQQ